MRMDRYKTFDEQERLNEEEQDEVLSRENKNQDMYKDVYMNNTFVDIKSLFGDEENEEEPLEENPVYEEEHFEEKSYDINDYIEKAHEMHQEDNAMRNLNNQEFVEQEQEIKKLIAGIDEKEFDLFSDLKGDNENTLIGGKLKTDEFDVSIYESLMDDEKNENAILDKALGSETFVNMEALEDEKLDHTFQKILEVDRKTTRKIKKLPLIIFIVTLCMLIGVILIIILK